MNWTRCLTPFLLFAFSLALARTASAQAPPGNAAAPPNTIINQRLIVVQVPGKNSIAAYSAERGGWQTYEVPPGVTATPVADVNAILLQLQGETIQELAGFSAFTGRWHRHPLREPFNGKISPAVGSEFGWCLVGRDLYAFSYKAGRWDMIEVERSRK